MTLSRSIRRLKEEARRLSRSENIPHHEALDRIARREGFRAWSLLAARAGPEIPSRAVFAGLEPGDLLLIAARPGQGKTLMGLRLAVEAMRAGRAAAFFTLEYAPRDIERRFGQIGADLALYRDRFAFDTSDDICAGTIVERLDAAAPGTLVVIDYLQLLDQRRDKPPLGDQVRCLRAFAKERGLVVAFIAQVDRTYDPAVKPFPGMDDIRLPNPLDLGLFDKACFLNGGSVRLHPGG